MAKVSPPSLNIPKKFREDPEVFAFMEAQARVIYDQWIRSGGGTDAVEEVTDSVTGVAIVTAANSASISTLNGVTTDLENEVATKASIAGLTPTRVPVMGPSSALVDDVTFTYDTGTDTLTAGAVVTDSVTFNGSPTVFNYYRQGTFTPVVVGSTLAGAGTYSTQTGVYTRIGNLVTFKIEIILTAHTGTGNMTITGLPFTSVGRSAADIACSDLTFTDFHLQAYVDNGSSVVSIRRAASAGADTAVAIDGVCSMWITGSYFV